MTATAARRAAQAVALLGAAGLAFTGSHLLSLRLADPHAHLHDHGLAHGAAADGQQRLLELHAYLGPAALLSALTLAAAAVVLRLLPAPPTVQRSATRRALPLTAALSSAVFLLVETAEHAVAVRGLPPLLLLAVGVLVHACGGLAAGALVRVLPAQGPPLPAGVLRLPVRPCRARRPRPAPLRPQALLTVLAGRAPPLTTAAPQPS